MKYSRTAIGLLTAQYRSVLKKCLLINLGLFALGAVAATPANADDPTWTPETTATSWADLAVQTDNFMEYLETGVYGEWNRAHSAVTGWGVDRIMAMMAPVASDTDSAIALIKNGTEYSGDTGKFGKGLYDAVGTQISGAISGKLDGTSTAYDSEASGNTYYTAATINSNFATQTTVGTKLTGTALTEYKETPDATEFYNAAAVNGNFVKQVTGKGLSSNDFTDTYKTSLDTLATTYQTKLAATNAGNGISISDAQVISVNNGAGLAFDNDKKLKVDLDTVADGTNNHLMSTDQQTKLNNISTATTTSGDGYVTGELLGTTLNGYATTATATTSNNGLMSKEDFSKLAGIEANAEVNTIEGIQLNGTDLTLDANKKANIVAATSANIAATEADASDSKLVTEKAVVAGLAGKQATLVSGDNIKSINGQSVLGAGNLTLDDIGAQAKITSANPLSHELVSGLGTAATVDLAGNYTPSTPPTDDDITTWAGTNAAKIATVGQTFTVLGDKMTIFQNDLFATGSTANSIAHQLGATGDTTLTQAVQNLADGQISAATYDGTIADGTADTKLATAAQVATYGATKQDKLTQTANAGANITIDSNGKISATDTTYTQGDGITIDSTAGNKISVNAKTDGGITVNGDGVSVDTSVVQAKLTAANAGDGIAFNSTGDVFSIDLAANSGLVIDDSGTDAGKLKVDRATVVQTGNAGIVDSDLLASQNYLKNSATSKLALDTANVADLSVWNGSNILAGINISSGADTNAIQMIVNGSSNDKKAAIELDKDGAFYSKSGTLNKTTDEIVTLGTAANGAYTNTAMTGVSTISGALDALQSSKQNTLTADNAGAGLAISDTGQVLSVGATDSSITVGADGIAVNYDNSTIGLTEGKLAVKEIAQSQVSGLGAALDAKAVITASGTDNVYTIADSKTGDGHVSKDFYDVTGTNAAIAASAATKANLAGGNQFTGLQEFGVNDGTFTAKASIDGSTGVASFTGVNVGADWIVTQVGENFSVRNAANKPVFNITPDGTVRAYKNNNQFLSISETDFHLTQNAIDYFTANTSNLMLKDSSGNTTFQVKNASGNVEAKGNVKAAGLTFDGTNVATGITATSGETAGALSLATAGYAQEQAKAAADGVVSIDASDATKINFNTQSGTPAVEATTYTADAIDTKLADKYNWSNITGATAAGSTPAETVDASTHVYSVDATDQAIANAFTTNTADAYAVSGKRSSALAAHIATYVEGNADKFATVQTTNNIITDLFNDKSLYIQGITGIPLTGSAADAYAASSQAMLHPATTLLNADEILAGEIVKKADDFDAGNGLAFVAASGSDPKTLNIDLLMSTGETPANISGLKIENGKLAIDKVAYSADAAENTYYDAATINENFAKASDPGQTIVAQEVDTKALKVANPLTGADENVILSAEYDATTDKNVIALNGATSIDGGLSVEDGLTTDTLTLPNAESGATPITVSGIKGVSGDNAPMLITAGAVDAEFNTKVGTLTKNTGTADVPVYTTRSVADMIGVDANGELKFTEAAGVTNIASGDGSKSTPTTIVGAFENISSALGKIHGLATNNGTATEPNITVNNNKSIFKAGNIVSSVTGETITSNLPTGTSVEEMEVYLDNAIGNIESGATLVGKAFADEDGNRIKTTYAKDADVVHKAGDETITGAKTFTSVVNANAGVKIGNDWQIDENPTTKAFIIRDASTTGTPMVAMITKDSMSLNSSAGNYFFVNDKGLSLNDTVGGAGTVFNASATTGDVIASKGKFIVATDTADASKVKVSVAGDIEATGNVKAASLTLPNVGASADVQVTAIDAGAADDFAAATDAGTLATMASVNKLAEKATFTPVAPTAGTVLTSTTIGDAINELNEKKFDKTDIVTTWSATTSDTKVASEKLVRDTLDDILDGDTPFTGFTMTNNAATPANVKMLAIDDGNYSDELATTFATNLSVKSAVDKLVFGGNPNIWTGVNEFQNVLKVTKENGSDPRIVLFQVDTTSGNTTIASLKLGDYATAMNGIDLMPTLNSYNHLVTSGGVYDALQGTGTTGETINFGSRADNIVIGKSAYNMTITKEGITTIGDGTTTGNIQMNKGALTAGTSVKVGSDSANSLMNASGLTVKNGDDNVAITSNSITLTDSGTSVFNVDQYGSITAGKASDAGQFSFDTHNGTASITTSKAPAISAAIAADGDSAAMEATDGTYDYLISANADMTTPANRGVVVGVTATGQNKLISGFEADNDSVGMGMADSNGDLVAGFSADKAAADQNIIEMGAFDNTDPDNPKLDTGVSVDSKGKTVSIAAAGYEVVNVSYDTTKGKGLVGVTGDLTATGNFSADNAGFTVSHNDTTGKTDVVATGDVKAASLTLPNLDQTTAGATITATAIDNNATAFPTSGADTTLATLSSIQNLAAQGAYTPGDQNSWRNPYAGDASTKPTTIAGALDRLATNLDAATNSLGDWSTLNAHVTASGYTGNGNITVTGTDPYKAPSAVSAVIDLDDAIGYRTLYNNTHYANTTGTAASVSQAIANMDTKVYEAIHGTGTPTAPDGKVFVGDAAKQIVIGNTKSDHKQYIRIDQESEQTLIGNTTFGETIDSINKVATIGGTNPNHYKMTLDGKNQKTTFGTPTNNITMEKGDLTATGNITAKGALSAENGTFTVTNDGTKTTMALTGDAQINGDESVTGKITVQATGSNAKVEIDHAGTITATDGTETAQYDAAGITLNNGTDDTFTVDTTNGDMMAAAGNFAVTTADGSATSLMSLTGDAVISGDTKTTTFTMPDAYQPTASSVQYAQVTSIDKGTTAANSFSDAALATTQSIKTKAENADYTASDALKAGNYATAQTSVATINNAIESLDLRIGDWDGLNLTPNGNLTNGHAGDSTYNEPTTVVEAFNNIDSTLGRIHGLVTDNGNGTYTYNKSSGAVTQDWTNLAVGTTVEEHVLAVDTAIGNRNGYTAAYNIHKGESVAESLNNIDLRLGDVKSLNNMHYYGEQNPNDVNLTGAVRALDNNLYRVEHDLKTLRHETHAGLASAAALSALVPNPRGTGDTTLSFGTGAYQGHTAAALGGFHWITNNLLVNAGVGWDNREATTRIGVSYSF